ncbi:hypothetical protein YTPLAS18_31700 [Nitrospira sp.]|nr:hypothetical protein YTPLAS18_31700 [Nitrospira sp.]
MQSGQTTRSFMITTILGGALLLGAAGMGLADEGTSPHKHFKGEVIDKAGGLAIKTKEGTTYQLSEREARRQDRQFKAGDKVEVTVNENNAIVDVHLEGEKSKHKFVTGKLMHVGKMKKEIKLQTAEGEKSFPLLLQETKTGGLAEGTEVTVEVNEAGTVIDLHKGKHEGH